MILPVEQFFTFEAIFVNTAKTLDVLNKAIRTECWFTEYCLKIHIAPSSDKIYCDDLKHFAAEINK